PDRPRTNRRTLSGHRPDNQRTLFVPINSEESFFYQNSGQISQTTKLTPLPQWPDCGQEWPKLARQWPKQAKDLPTLVPSLPDIGQAMSCWDAKFPRHFHISVGSHRKPSAISTVSLCSALFRQNFLLGGAPTLFHSSRSMSSVRRQYPFDLIEPKWQ